MKAQQLIRDGAVVVLEGLGFELREGQIEPGDWYIAERNAGPKLLTAKKVDRENRWIFAEERAYAYNLGECVRVQLVDPA